MIAIWGRFSRALITAMLFGFLGLVGGAMLTVITMGVGPGLLLVGLGGGCGAGLIIGLKKDKEFDGVEVHQTSPKRDRLKQHKLKQAAELLQAKPQSLSVDLLPHVVLFSFCLGFAVYTRIENILANLLCISLASSTSSDGIAGFWGIKSRPLKPWLVATPYAIFLCLHAGLQWQAALISVGTYGVLGMVREVVWIRQTLKEAQKILRVERAERLN